MKKTKQKSGKTKARKAHQGAARVGKKPVGKPPAALRAKAKKNRSPRAVAPPPRDVGLLDAIGEVMGICEELAQEMHDWSDNMPDSKQGSSKQDEVDACAETLDNVVGDDPCDETTDQTFLNEIKVSIQDPTPRRQARSRSTRLSDATSILIDVIEQIEKWDDDTRPEDQKAAASELKDKLEEIESELQGVDFPGMFG